jgi:hypothetical protein
VVGHEHFVPGHAAGVAVVAAVGVLPAGLSAPGAARVEGRARGAAGQHAGWRRTGGRAGAAAAAGGRERACISPGVVGHQQTAVHGEADGVVDPTDG